MYVDKHVTPEAHSHSRERLVILHMRCRFLVLNYWKQQNKELCTVSYLYYKPLPRDYFLH